MCSQIGILQEEVQHDTVLVIHRIITTCLEWLVPWDSARKVDRTMWHQVLILEGSRPQCPWARMNREAPSASPAFSAPQVGQSWGPLASEGSCSSAALSGPLYRCATGKCVCSWGGGVSVTSSLLPDFLLG